MGHDVQLKVKNSVKSARPVGMAVLLVKRGGKDYMLAGPGKWLLLICL